MTLAGRSIQSPKTTQLNNPKPKEQFMVRCRRACGVVAPLPRASSPAAPLPAAHCYCAVPAAHCAPAGLCAPTPR